jgi:carboxylesterase
VIYAFADLVGRRLLAWGVLSVAAGAWLLATGDAFGRGLGAAFLLFGAVDAAIGVAARVGAERGRRRTISDEPARTRETVRIRRILLVNAALDVLYVSGGLWLAASAGGDAWRTGAGLGIIVQGAFLLVFDLLHASWVPAPGPLLPDGVDLFTGPGHDPFRLAPAAATPDEGVLLVHGFAGSPQEMRPLAAVLASNGFMVEVPRLPGHGPDIRDIADYRLEDWISTVTAGAAHLRELGVRRLVVVGHSVGGSLALATAAAVAPDALVLLAPFNWSTSAWQRALGPLARTLLPPGFAVFSRVDLADPEVRGAMASLLPGLDLDDPAVVAGLRELRIPTVALEQLFRVAHAAERAAPSVHVPVLAIQGLRDSVSRPAQTRRLLDRLPVPPAYQELDAAHDLASEGSPVRDEVLRIVLAFVQDVGEPHPGEPAGVMLPDGAGV